MYKIYVDIDLSFSSVQFSHSVVFDSLRPHGLQHTRPPCPSPTPEFTQTHVHWVSDTIQPSHPVIPFSCLQSFPASGSFQMSPFFVSGGRRIEASAWASVFPMNIQNWFPLNWLVGSPCSPRDSQESSPTTQFKSIKFSVLSFLYGPTLTSIHDY